MQKTGIGGRPTAVSPSSPLPGAGQVRTLVAIGGGEIGRPGRESETLPLDLELVKLSGKSRPRLLFIPTASSDCREYSSAVESHFQRMGCDTETLYLLDGPRPAGELRDLVLGSDIVYVGGGNTAMMLAAWRGSGLDAILREAWESGTIVAGLSAGAICWFREGISDSERFADRDAGLVVVEGLGLVDIPVCPHYDAEADRRIHMRDVLRGTRDAIIALDDCVSLAVIGDRYRVLSSRPQAWAYLVRWEGNDCREDPLPPEGPSDWLRLMPVPAP